jgi:hypothetical protein
MAAMDESPRVPPDPYLVDAQIVVERVIWPEGITGEACARVAIQVISALVEAGFVTSPASDGAP